MRSRKTNMLEAFRASAMGGSGRPAAGPGERVDESREPTTETEIATEPGTEPVSDQVVEVAVQPDPPEPALEPSAEPAPEPPSRGDAGPTPQRIVRRFRVVPDRTSVEEPTDETPAPAATREAWTVSVSRRTLFQIALFQLVLLSLFFFMGRASVSQREVAAAADPPVTNEADALSRALGTPVSGAARGGEPAPVAAKARGAERFAPKTAADRAFWSTANKYSVRAIQYPRTDAGEKMAWQTYDYIGAQGLPVVTPLAKGDAILICVGARPTMADLATVHDRLRALPGPQPDIDRRPFRSAYLVNIDDVVGSR